MHLRDCWRTPRASRCRWDCLRRWRLHLCNNTENYDILNSQGCVQEFILQGVTPCGPVNPFTLLRATRCLNRQRRRLSPFLRVDFLGAFAMQLLIATTDCLVARVRPSVCPHGRSRLVSQGFSWNFLFWVFTYIFQHISVLVKVRQDLTDTSHLLVFMSFVRLPEPTVIFSLQNYHWPSTRLITI